MMKTKCPHCKKEFVMKIPAWQAKQIRSFKQKYPWVLNNDLGKMFALGRTRISEIVRGIKKQYIPRNPKGD